MIKEIAIKSGTKYLSDVMHDLPDNCIFDKGRVGGGGTTVALRNNKDYIIAVPFVSLIENKLSQDIDGSYCGVFGSLTPGKRKIIRRYHESKSPRKYLVTYDSLEKLISIIENIDGFKLLIDEYHILFTQYSFREGAANKVLNNFKKFEKYCFMSATPLSPEYVLEELKELPLEKAVWEDPDPITVNSIKCDDILSTVRSEINKYLNNQITGNAYFFINSILFIRDLILENGLVTENTRIICSKSNRENDVIEGIPNSDTFSDPKKINLITSTAFEGADLYDEEGRTYIVSDADREHTLTDISTSFVQISGRIRNTRFHNELTHYYTQTWYSDQIPYEDFKEACDEEAERASRIIKQYNENLDDEARNAITGITSNQKLITRSDKYFKFNINRYNLELYEYKLCNSLYLNGRKLHQEYLLKGFSVVRGHSDIVLERRVGLNGNLTLQEAVEYIKSTGIKTQMSKNGYSYSPEPNYNEEEYEEYVKKIESYFKRWPWLEDAIYYLQYEEIERLNYHHTNIRRLIESKKLQSKSSRVANLLEVEGVTTNKCFTNTELKVILEKVYKMVDYYGSAKATEIEKYFNVKAREIKGVKGYLIRNKRTVFE